MSTGPWLLLISPNDRYTGFTITPTLNLMMNVDTSHKVPLCHFIHHVTTTP